MWVYCVVLSQTSEEVNAEPQCQGVQPREASAVCGEMGWGSVDLVFPQRGVGGGAWDCSAVSGQGTDGAWGQQQGSGLGETDRCQGCVAMDYDVSDEYWWASRWDLWLAQGVCVGSQWAWSSFGRTDWLTPLSLTELCDLGQPLNLCLGFLTCSWRMWSACLRVGGG